MAYVNAVLVGIFTGGAYALIAREWPPVLGALVALAVTMAYGMAVERLAIRPVRHGSSTTKLIATLGVLALTTGLLLLVYGFEPTSAPLLLPDRLVSLGSLRITYQQVTVLIVAGVAAGVLGWFLQTTRFGIAVRAVAQNAETSRLMGVSLTQVARFNWLLGSALAGITGILLAPLSPVTAATFTLLLAKALTGTLFGGLMSLPLAFAGGIAVGVLDSLTIMKSSSPGAKELVTLIVVVGLLVFRRSWAPEMITAPAAEMKRPNVVLNRIRATLAGPWSRLGPRAPLIVAVTILAVLIGNQIQQGNTSSGYWGFVGARGLFFVIEALSLVILVGWGGQASLMHGAYVGIGAFTTAYLVVERGVPLELAIVLAGVAGMLMGALAGLPALRLSGLQFGIASLAFAGAASEWLFRRPEFPKSLPRGTFFGVDLFDDLNLFLVMLPITIILYVLVWNLRRSTFGPLLLSSRDAGTTVAHFGIESMSGPLIAGIVFGIVPQLIQKESGPSASALPDVIAGATVILLIALRPRGLASLFERPKSRGSTEGSDGGPAITHRGAHSGRFDFVIGRREARARQSGNVAGRPGRLRHEAGIDNTAVIEVTAQQETEDTVGNTSIAMSATGSATRSTKGARR
ncbi:MAG: ABC transporter permease [Actinobacteria bacterium]|nr:ABC transporter permease [Actinomycetota bacterium]